MANEDCIQVLLVEDSPSDARLLCEFLQDYPPQQFAVEHVECLEDAIRRVADRTFDVVLLDLTLPDSTGLDTCVRMRGAAPHLPIVVLTGVDDETVALEAMHRGIDDYLVKGQVQGGTVGRATRYAVERNRATLALRAANEGLLQLNRTLRALSNSSQALTHATEEAAYLQEVCRIVVQDCGHTMVWIGYAEDDEAKSVRPVAHAGFEEGYLETLQITWADTERGHGPTGRAIRTGQPSLCRNMLTDPSFAPWREQAVKRGYASSIVLPLLSEGKAFGAITIYAREPDPFSRDEIELLTELAADLTHGIITLRLRAAHASAETALRESEARLRLAQDAANAGTWEWDLQTNRSYWSEELWKLYGLEPYSCEPTHEAWRQTVLPEDLSRIERAVQQASHQETMLNAEWRVRDRQGHERWLMSRGQPVRDADGRITMYRGIVLDITERKRAEEALRESEQRLRLALEGGQMGRWEWDVRNDTTFWDERVYELLGREPAGGASSRLFFSLIDTQDRDRVRQRVDQALAGGGELYAEFRVQRPNDERPWLVSKGKVIRDEQGQAVRMMGVMYDITRRKQMEADLRRLNDQLEEEVQAQTEELKDTVDRLQEEVSRRVLAEERQQTAFQELEQRARQLQKLTLEVSQAEDRERKRLAEILHDDLQQQLAAAKFHLSLLARRAAPDPATQRVVAQLDQILKDSIEKSRSLSHELSPAVLYQSDLGETFDWLARQLKAKHGLKVDVESRGPIDPVSEPLKVFLYRTAQEILFNVVKHARVREARLRVQRMNGSVWLTISDRGQGFETRSLGKADGFGLLSIRERIELLGGRMKIRSAPGRGSTFLIAVPDRRESADSRRGTEDRGQTTDGRAAIRPLSSTIQNPSSVLHVLLVDDHKVVREGLATLLNEQPDLKVVGQAGNGREAVDLAYRLQPDVVVMDVSMPVMAGDEAARQIKLHSPQTRIVALSMFEAADMAQAMRQAGAEAYLLKTAPSDELLAAIRGKA